MRQALVIKRDTGYVSNTTGQLVEISSQEALLDGFFTGSEKKYTFIELYKKLGVLKAKTLRQLNDDAWKFAEENTLGYDFELYIIK